MALASQDEQKKTLYNSSQPSCVYNLEYNRLKHVPSASVLLLTRRYLINHGHKLIPSLAGLHASLPANLTAEPGLSHLALATQAYLALYGGVANVLQPATDGLK